MKVIVQKIIIFFINAKSKMDNYFVIGNNRYMIYSQNSRRAFIKKKQIMTNFFQMNFWMIKKEKKK